MTTLRAERGRWTPQDRAASVWHYLDFDAATDCPGLRIDLAFDRTAGVLDLGLIDPAGWRGWSGSAREQVLIGRSSATPGYLNRGVPSGQWQVVLGLHRLASAGVDYELTVTAEPVEVARALRVAVPEARPRRVLPSVDGLSWLAGDLHAHTVHSDGALSIDELAALAAGKGLDFLAVTDHNTVSHHEYLAAAGARYGLALLPGQEVTTADGHANAFGDIGWIDFRQPADGWVSEVARRGGLLSINHPVRGDCAWRHPLAARPRLAEVWHSSWHDKRDGGPLAWWSAAGYPTPVGGSDWHQAHAAAGPGTPTTWVACADGDVLGAIAAGRTAISAGYEAPLLLRIGEDLVAIDADGAVLVCPHGGRCPVRGSRAAFSGHDGPHLLELDDRTIVAIAA
ncbi:MAG: CehA/McbA family metallohydrolase [Actinomycetota bacterium]|nr:CehA/McbA family metallohydrolase [Actinomycetota bacterium]